ncbi:VanZ family protein [Flavobacterium sp. NRK F10]|uniref:VanZ family protein n=1 Tax=Flavobacterium sp. NRK F10 TaxID=2954931 RepID=UPI002090833B|nr:VanZ family protein [Flavobacterium sp. NRK F10]MCO6175151.1 VanZ family protein [Flavobacterium sp. NRK F10]
MQRLSERKFFFVAILWTLAITYLSLVSIDTESAGSFLPIPNKDKVVHFLFYFFFVYFWSKTFKQSDKFFYIVIVAVIYGIIIEVLQGVCTVNRQADFFDVLANTCGAVLAMLILKPKL